MCSNEKYFTSLVPFSGIIKCASKTKNLEIKCVGNIIGKLPNGVNVLYVPDLNGLLVVIRRIENANYAIIFKNEKIFIEKGKKFVLFW